MAEFTKYEQDGHIFEVHYESENCRICIKSKGLLNGLIYYDKNKGTIHAESYSTVGNFNTVEEALPFVCSNMIKDAPPSEEEIHRKCKEMDEFYSKLKGKNT